MCSRRFDLQGTDDCSRERAVPAHGDGGLDMLSIHRLVRLLPAMAVLLFAWGAVAQSFRVQCPAGTDAHPATVPADGTYSTKTIWGRTDGLLNPTPAMAKSGIKCQQISG